MQKVDPFTMWKDFPWSLFSACNSWSADPWLGLNLKLYASSCFVSKGNRSVSCLWLGNPDQPPAPTVKSSETNNLPTFWLCFCPKRCLIFLCVFVSSDPYCTKSISFDRITKGSKILLYFAPAINNSQFLLTHFIFASWLQGI